MTLQQLRYVTTVAETGTMSEAARRLFVSQPGLTKAIRELEQEMGIIIFDRTNKGIEVSKDGAIFLGYARCWSRQHFWKSAISFRQEARKNLVSLHNIILSQSMHLLT